MRKIVAVILMVFTTSAFARDIQVKVSGMVCSMCAQGIQKKFSELKEVKKINVDLDNKLVEIKTEGETDIDDATITKLITEAGYNVAGIERK